MLNLKHVVCKSCVLLLLVSGFGVAAPMVLEYDTRLGDSLSSVVNIPLAGEVNVTIDWGDDNDTLIKSPGLLKHNYLKDTLYTITISGKLTHFGKDECSVNDEPNLDELVRVVSFGDLGLTSLRCAFANAKNLKGVPSKLPSGVVDLSSFFLGLGTSYQIIDLENRINIDSLEFWDVSSVTNMERAFQYAETFDQDLGSWNVGSVVNMAKMFQNAYIFNQDISQWQVGSVSDMTGMFDDARYFNQDIANWDVSSVVTMKDMFFLAIRFDGNVGGWDVSSVTDMSGMFSNAHIFNQDIGTWDVSSVTNMIDMFSSTQMFNQKVDKWQVGSVTDMSGMFSGAKAFDQDLSTWDVSSVTNMSGMFNNATVFNQDISAWDVSSVENMGYMFQYTDNFDQNIGIWNVGLVEDMGRMFHSASLSTSNYDSLLIGWSKQTLQKYVDFSAGKTKYSSGAAADARAVLGFKSWFWKITDGGVVGGILAVLENSTEVTSIIGKAEIYNLKGEILWQGTLPEQLNQAKQVLKAHQRTSLLKTPNNIFKISNFK